MSSYFRFSDSEKQKEPSTEFPGCKWWTQVKWREGFGWARWKAGNSGRLKPLLLSRWRPPRLRLQGLTGRVLRASCPLSCNHAIERRPIEPQRREERREKNENSSPQRNHCSVTDFQAAETGFALRSSRLCGSLAHAPTEWIRLSPPHASRLC